MFISIKKLLHDTGDAESAEALQRFAQIVLQTIRIDAIDADRVDYLDFQGAIAQIEAKLAAPPSPAEILVLAGATAKAVSDYNQRTTRFVRAHGFELQKMVSMLTDTVASIASANEHTVLRLESTQKQLERAAVIEDVRLLKAGLSECLQTLREETMRHREDSARTVAALKDELHRSQKRILAAEVPDEAEADFVPQGRSEAETALTLAFKEHRSGFAAVFSLGRFSLIKDRFGESAGEQVLSYFEQHLRQGLSAADQLFRWADSTFVLLHQGSEARGGIPPELLKLGQVRLQTTVDVGPRTVLLPIGFTWAAFPLHSFSSPHGLFGKIDTFVEK